MESRSRSIDRLLTALETLVDQEATQVAAGDLGGILKTQKRTAPVVERLAEIGAHSTDAAAHARVAAVLEKRRQSRQHLAEQISRVRCELDRARASQRRLAGIAPLYFGRARKRPARRLSALG
jgi:uncharacterized protein with PIN domain